MFKYSPYKEKRLTAERPGKISFLLMRSMVNLENIIVFLECLPCKIAHAIEGCFSLLNNTRCSISLPFNDSGIFEMKADLASFINRILYDINGDEIPYEL